MSGLVNAYVGLMGDGKSYGVVENVILPAIRNKRFIYTSLALDLAVIEAEFPGASDRITIFNNDEYAENPAKLLDIPPGTVVVVDEAQEIWKRGLQPAKCDPALVEFITKLRHRVDVDRNSQLLVLVTQDLSNVAGFACKLIKQTFRVVKLTALGADKTYRVDVFNGYVTGIPPASKRTSSLGPFRYSEKVWKFYHSHTMSEAEGSGANEKSLDRRGVAWRHPKFLIGAPIALACFVGGVWGVVSWLTPEATARAENAPQRAGGPAVGAQTRGPGPAARNEPRPGRAWAITGSMEFADDPARSIVLISDGTWQTRIAMEGNCRRFVQGFLQCTYQGQVFTNEMQAVQREAPAMPRVGLGDAFGHSPPAQRDDRADTGS